MFSSVGSKSSANPIHNKSLPRVLNLEVVEARSLIALNKNGTSDPYVTLSLLDLGGRPVKGESFKTAQKSGTLTPVWNDKFSFGNVYNLDVDDNLPSVQLELFHKGQLAVADAPLGNIVISLDTIDPSGKEVTDLWYPVEAAGRMKSASGEVHIRMSFNRFPSSTDVEAGGKSGDSDDDEIDANEAPNELVITVIQARGLLAVDKPVFGPANSDPMVRIKIDGFDSQKTKHIKKNLNPVWNTPLNFPGVEDSGLTIEVIVEDHNDISSHTFLGKTIIPIKQFDDKKSSRKWYSLKNKNGEVDKDKRGEVELMIHWKFSTQVKAESLKKKDKLERSAAFRLTKQFSAVGKAIGVAEESDDEAEDDDPDHEDKQEETERPKTEEEKDQEKKKEEEKKKELEDIDIKPGDYQIQVHIIEARDLKAENMDGTSDPVVYIECFGQKRNTIVIKQVTSCVFDEVFIFNMKDLDKEAFEDGFIRISCYDSNALGALGGGNTMIGSYALDAAMVYSMNKHHELYREWVPLMDDEDPEDVGVQGYLKMSIQIVGPGEKIKIHDEDAERAAEIAREAAVGSDVGSLIFNTPIIQKEWKYLVCKLYKCEGLPVMDGKVGMSVATIKKAGTDAFCKLSMGGGKPIKTKVVTAHGENRLMINPTFNIELWYPVSVPTMTQIVKFSVWDQDITENELIGVCSERFNVIKKADKQDLGLRWYNFYGAPEFKTEQKLTSNIKKVGAGFANAALQTFGGEVDWSAYYNNNPEKATTYKGRALIGFRIEDSLPPKKEKKSAGEVKPFRLKVKGLKSSLEPPVRDYVLQALVVIGNELPSFGTISNQSLRVKISMGNHEIGTKPAKFESHGLCRWNEHLISDTLQFPVDSSQLPDIFIHLVREDNRPVCFYRLKPIKNPKTKQLIGFSNPAEWYFLQEDKSINGLSDDVFAGTVLIKLGFGYLEDSNASLPQWQESAKKITMAVPHQVRVHLFQGKNLPAADQNGLSDPYVRVHFLGQRVDSDKKKNTLFPVYYQTLTFDNVIIPNINDYEFASQISLRVYDTNIIGDRYLGSAFFNLKNAIVSSDHNMQVLDLKDPYWLPLFREQPGDGQGHILASVQLIPTMNKSIPRPLSPKIEIPTRSAYIEFLIIGVRDMAPYNFQSMQAPFLEVELCSFHSVYKSATTASKRPDPSNPNYLERIILPVELPEKSIFSTPLQIKARDTRLGGYLKPLVGVCQIDLSTKLPWDESTYVPPRTDVFFQPAQDNMLLSADGTAQAVDPIALKTKELQRKRQGELVDDEFVASQEPLPVEHLIRERMANEDTGAGIFGALHHIKADGSAKKKKKPEDAFSDPDWTQDDGDQPPAWSVGRKKLEAELEAEFQTTPFETYSLTRGSNNALLGTKLKTVGRLKGLVRIVSDKKQMEEEPLIGKALMDELLSPKRYQIRLYCLKASKLEAMDTDIFGQKANSDPYLKVRLGKFTFNDREHAVNDVTDVDLYKMVTLDTELPGVSQLSIEIMDKDLIGSDDLIGKTTIDLEDRWFDGRWQEWGKENQIMPGDDPSDPSKVRYKTKPIERRNLYAPGFSLGRGVLECWVDILTPEQALAFPPDDVSLPPTTIFEVRVVIWKTKNVPPMDSLEGMSDLFVKAWPEGSDPQETDTHWRCKKGKASFNWRMLFDVELGHNTRPMKFPYLHLQLWDRDILKWNDCAGEGVIDLGRYYRKAYKRNIAIKLFEQKKGVAAKRAKKEGQKKRFVDIQDTGEDIPPDEFQEEDFSTLEKNTEDSSKSGSSWNPFTRKPSTTDPAKDDTTANQPTGNYVNPSTLLPPRAHPDSDDDDDEDHGLALLDSAGGAPARKVAKTVESRGTRLIKKVPKPVKEEVDETAEETPVSWWAFWRKKKEESDEEGKNGEQVELVEKSEGEKKEDEDEELKSLITSFKNMTGLWDIDPEDSNWYHLETRDKNDPSKVTPMGSICYSIQIWPKDKATVMAVGASRSEPNTNPFLPPPTGRLKFSWNPFVLGSELCGPVLCAKLFCCFICMAFILLMIFCQPFLNIIINLIFVVY